MRVDPVIELVVILLAVGAAIAGAGLLGRLPEPVACLAVGVIFVIAPIGIMLLNNLDRRGRW